MPTYHKATAAAAGGKSLADLRSRSSCIGSSVVQNSVLVGVKS